jgi:hypothetical protein
MQFFGLSAEDYIDETTVEVWLDNVAVINLFVQIGGQWRVGSLGPYALDYNVLYHKLDRMGLTPEAYQELEADIAILEQAALEEMSKT